MLRRDIEPYTLPGLLRTLSQNGLLTSTSLRLDDPDASVDRLEALCRFVGTTHNASAWWAGDLILITEILHPQEASQIVEALGASPDTRGRWARTAERIPPERRRSELSWSHHFIVSTLPPEEQDEWLQKAIDNNYSKHEMEALLRPPPAIDKVPVVDEDGVITEEDRLNLPVPPVGRTGNILYAANLTEIAFADLEDMIMKITVTEARTALASAEVALSRWRTIVTELEHVY